jgi:hypothetical protein
MQLFPKLPSIRPKQPSKPPPTGKRTDITSERFAGEGVECRVAISQLRWYTNPKMEYQKNYVCRIRSLFGGVFTRVSFLVRRLWQKSMEKDLTCTKCDFAGLAGVTESASIRSKRLVCRSARGNLGTVLVRGDPLTLLSRVGRKERFCPRVVGISACFVSNG